ncbi:MAG: hypothetical protein GY755_16950 [Chloroflexi bacterium]|nr:hypothetical protein [Chloroflexota bacterium]
MAHGHPIVFDKETCENIYSNLELCYCCGLSLSESCKCGNPDSEAGKAIIADAVEVKERMWHIHAMRDHTCYDNGLTSELCHACEAQELSEDSEMLFS